MDFDNIYNPLSYDNKLLQDKLGMSFMESHRPLNNSMSMDERIKKKMMEQEIKNNIRNEIKNNIRNEIKKRKPIRETFVGSRKCDCECCDHGDKPKCAKCNCAEYNKNDMYEPLPLFSNNTLIIFIFILAAVCILQYFSQQTAQNRMNDMLNMIHTMFKSPPPGSNVVATSPT